MSMGLMDDIEEKTGRRVNMTFETKESIIRNGGADAGVFHVENQRSELLGKIHALLSGNKKVLYRDIGNGKVQLYSK